MKQTDLPVVEPLGRAEGSGYPERPGRRWAALAGVVFAVLFFLGTAMLNVPRGATGKEVVDWWSDAANQVTAAVSMYCFALAGLFFLVFVAHLRDRLHTAEGGNGPLTRLVFAGGVLFVAMLWVTAAARGVIGTAVALNHEPLPDVDLLRYLPQLSSVLLGMFAMLGAVFVIVITSWAILRTGAFGRWLAWLGFLASAALLAAQAVFVGEVAIPAMLIWAVATSIAMYRRTTAASLR